MKKFTPVFIAGLLACPIFAASSDLRLSDAAAARVEAVRTAVVVELAVAGSPSWAGEYLASGLSLIIAPKGGFAYERRGETHLFDRNVGTVTARDGVLRLLCVYPNYRDAFHGLCPDLVPVGWGGRTYLVGRDAMLSFCNSVNLGREPRATAAGAHLMHVGDEAKSVSGKPAVPAAFTRYLLDAPVEIESATVVSEKLRTTAGTKYVITFRTGSEKGLFAGMELCARQGESLVSLKLTKVDRGTSEGEVLVIGEGVAPEVGLKFSSRE